MEKIPQKYHEAIRMLGEGFDVRHVARVTGHPWATLRSLIYRLCKQHNLNGQKDLVRLLPPTAPKPWLSAKEVDILRMLAEGIPSKEVATRMGMPRPNLYAITTRLRAEVGANNTAALVKAFESGHFDYEVKPTDGKAILLNQLRVARQQLDDLIKTLEGA